MYCGTTQTPEHMIDMLECGKLYPPIACCVDAKAVHDSIRASHACEPAESSLKLHLISVRDRMAHGLIRRFYWVDTRDMLADGLTKGGIDRLFLHRCRNGCKYVVKRHFEPHSKFFGSSSTNVSKAGTQGEPLEEEGAEWAPGQEESLHNRKPHTHIPHTIHIRITPTNSHRSRY